MVQLFLWVNVKKTAAVSFLLSFILHVGKYLLQYMYIIKSMSRVNKNLDDLKHSIEFEARCVE